MPQVFVGSKVLAARRYVWENLVGPVPPGHFVMLKKGVCNHHQCVCPDHLEPISAAEKSRRRAKQVVGNRLDIHQVRAIKGYLQQGRKVSEIARMFGVHYQAVYLIHRGKRWRHVPWGGA